MAATKCDAKLVILGDSGVGKSSLVFRFLYDDFKPYSESTIGASFMSKVVNGINFKIWDTAGQEKYRALSSMYFRGAAAAILVYDVTNFQSFLGMQTWVDELKEKHTSGASGNSDEPSIVLAVCANKIDLVGSKERQVDAIIAEDYARDIGACYFETSAKEDTNVRALFLEIADRLPKSSNSIINDLEERQQQKTIDFNQAFAERSTTSSCCYT